MRYWVLCLVYYLLPCIVLADDSFSLPEKELDQAISDCMKGNASDAFALFDHIIAQYSPPPGIVTMIEFYKSSQCYKHEIMSDEKSVQGGALELSLGRTDNLNQGINHNSIILNGLSNTPILVLSENMRPQSDMFHQAVLDYQYNRWYTNISFKDYSEHQDYQMVSGNIAYSGKNMGISVNRNQLGGKLYLQDMSIALFDRSLDQLWQWGIKLHQQRYFIGNNNDNKQYEPFIQFGQNNWTTYFSLIWDRPESNRLGGERKGFSGYAQYQTSFALGVLSAMAYYHQLYDQDRYSPEILDTIRLHQLMWLRLRYSYPIDDRQMFYIEMSKIYSEDRLPLYDYDSNQMSMGWRYHW